jgi:RNA polymerase primary sigma factor
MLGSLASSATRTLDTVARSMANERQTAPQSDIKILISKGLEQGYLTYAEVNDHLPNDIVDPEQIEDIVNMINGMGIDGLR